MSNQNEVWIGPEDPTALDPEVELWYDPTPRPYAAPHGNVRWVDPADFFVEPEAIFSADEVRGLR